MKSSLHHRQLIRIICVGLFVSAAILAPRAESQQTQFPDGPGKDAFLKTCSNCHSPDNVIGIARDADAWSDTLNKMIQNGATGSDDEFSAILDYLSTNFGPAPEKINMNKATAMNLRNWLKLTQKDADAVIAYRTQNGDFKSLDDVKKVPGIDLKIIDAKKDHLAF
jgi:competence protein ComEA